MRNSRVCQKCGYQRVAADDKVVAEGICPRCGVVYQKAAPRKNAPESRPDEKAAPQKDASESRPDESVDAAPQGEPGCGLIGCISGFVLGVIGGFLWSLIKCTFFSCRRDFIDEASEAIVSTAFSVALGLGLLGFVIGLFKKILGKRRSKHR